MAPCPPRPRLPRWGVRRKPRQVALALRLGGPELGACRVESFGVEDRSVAGRVRRRHVHAVFTHARGELRQRCLVGRVFQESSAALELAAGAAAAALFDRGLQLCAGHAVRQLWTAGPAAAEKSTRTPGTPAALTGGSLRQRDAVLLQTFAHRLEASSARPCRARPGGACACGAPRGRGGGVGARGRACSTIRRRPPGRGRRAVGPATMAMAVAVGLRLLLSI